MTERTTVRLPPDLLMRAKRKASAEGLTLTALIEDGLRRVLTDVAAEPKKKRVLPPISKATGGMHPGVDLAHGSTLQEAEDLDYVRRMKRFK